MAMFVEGKVLLKLFLLLQLSIPAVSFALYRSREARAIGKTPLTFFWSTEAEGAGEGLSLGFKGEPSHSLQLPDRKVQPGGRSGSSAVSQAKGLEEMASSCKS